MPSCNWCTLFWIQVMPSTSACNIRSRTENTFEVPKHFDLIISGTETLKFANALPTSPLIWILCLCMKTFRKRAHTRCTAIREKHCCTSIVQVLKKKNNNVFAGHILYWLISNSDVLWGKKISKGSSTWSHLLPIIFGSISEKYGCFVVRLPFQRGLPLCRQRMCFICIYAYE